MGLTAHLALAFEPSEKANVIAMLSGEGDDGGNAAIAYQPDFHLARENHYEVHRVLEVLSEGNLELAPIGTVVIGTAPVAEAGMGIQYFHTAEAVRSMARAYKLVTPDALRDAIERVGSEFEPDCFAGMPEAIAETFEIIRGELAVVADNGWAMISGMW